MHPSRQKFTLTLPPLALFVVAHLLLLVIGLLPRLLPQVQAGTQYVLAHHFHLLHSRLYNTTAVYFFLKKNNHNEITHTISFSHP